MESKKAEFTEIESIMVVSRGWEVDENRAMLVKGDKHPPIRWVTSGDLMYSMVAVINNTVLYICKLLRE